MNKTILLVIVTSSIICCGVVYGLEHINTTLDYDYSVTDAWSTSGGWTWYQADIMSNALSGNISHINGAETIEVVPQYTVNFYAEGYPSVNSAVGKVTLCDVQRDCWITIKPRVDGGDDIQFDFSEPLELSGSGITTGYVYMYINGGWRSVVMQSIGNTYRTTAPSDGACIRLNGATDTIPAITYVDRNSHESNRLIVNTTVVSGYSTSDVFLYREVGNVTTPSAFKVQDYTGYIYLDTPCESDDEYTVVGTYPVYMYVSYGSPVSHKTFSISYTPDGNYTFDETPILPTPTPTPSTDLCRFWSLSLNTSNINRNEAVLGTLTEADPNDRYDMIDWYRVLPNGNEHITKHYVYDAGLFGLGAGWFLVDSYTGYTEVSSVDEALENEIDFTTSGGAHYVRVRIYDDKSLLPLVYHDYDHVCTKEAIVYVGETTQSLTQQGINVYEADTNAFLSQVSLNVYDYGTAEWQNKTSSYGSTTYFNAVPGHSMRVLANKTGWLSSDSTFTVSNPPVTYPVYLKRPLVDVVNESYVFFNVRDSVTHTGLYQATIQLSDGQLQSTMPSGYAGFSVNDSESYYYTVSKPGYQTLTSTFSISEDTTIPVLLVQIAPTPTVTLPITTLPTVTVTGTLTPTVTGTTTLTATATGTYSNATLAAAERVQKTTKAADVWYTNAETLSNLLFLAVIVGVLGLMSNAMDKRRRRR